MSIVPARFVDQRGTATRAVRVPCSGSWEYDGCGEVLRLDEIFDHLVGRHPAAGPQALLLAALAELSTSAGVIAGTNFYSWIIAIKNLDDWNPGVRDVLHAVTDIADTSDPLAEALAVCTPADRRQLSLIFDLKQTQHPDQRLWSALSYIIGRFAAGSSE